MTWKVPGRVDALKKLWADGLSARDIAARLGPEVTRNAVISKADRLKLPRRAPMGRKGPRRSRSKPAPSAKPQRMPDAHGALSGLPLPPVQDEDVARVATLDLEPWHCRWAVGDPIEVGPRAPLFCGARKLPGLPYCGVHSRRAYNKPVVAETAPAPTRELETAA